ncbi:CHAT domain-containing protein [Nocardia fusca]|uniref:CHAT domain-containing protein n=1 Tax=Nocardia fusca TaxID=941183 RepID=UPI0018DDCE8C|nr:CHAT domain-containing protein [Nocardia fusca]
MRWLSGAIVAGGAGMAGWGWWLGQRQGLVFRLNPESSASKSLTTNGTGQYLYPLVSLAIMLLIAGSLQRRREDIRIGWAAWREHPVALSLGALVWAAAPWCCLLLGLLLRDWAGGVPAGRHLSRWLLADRPFFWFIGVLCTVLSVHLIAAGPWLTDYLCRVLRYQRRFRRLQRQGKQETLAREVLKLGEEIAERPYREQILIGLLLRIDAGGPHHELWDSVLRTVSRMPRLDEPGRLFRLSPLWKVQVRMRLVLAEALMSEYHRTQASPHLDTALRILEGLHRCPPVLAGRAARAGIALTLAWALGLRHTRNPGADAGGLGRALALAEQAAIVLPAEAAGGVVGRLLVKQYERQADVATLSRAIDALRSAGPSSALIWALVLRHRTAANGSDLMEAGAIARDLAAEAPDGEEGLFVLLFTAIQSPAWRFGSERALVVDLLDVLDALPTVSFPLNAVTAMCRAALALDEDHEMALSWYERALMLTEQSASLGLSLHDRKVVLGTGVLSPPSVADIALSMGQAGRAVELLELSRTVIWAQTRRLRRIGPPLGVPARLTELRSELDNPRYPGPGSRDLLSGHRAARARAELAAEWESLTAEHDSGRRMGFSELREAAHGGPVVIVNISDTGCAAVVVLADRDPVHIGLPLADHAELAARAGGLLVATIRGMNARALARLLWDTIAAPVLEVVEPYLGPDRRVWWCPTGPLSAVPLHLAGHHDQKNGPALIDHVVSSYTPSLWALRDARRTGPDVVVPTRPSTMLVASLRETPGMPELEHAEEEAAIVSSRFPAVRALGEQEVTVAAIRAALHDHPWVHIACHGDENGLVLHDGHLGLDELADMKPTGERLAFLSACVSALPDARAVDEVLHPAAAFHLNGFSHVIGTMWQINSADGPTVADDFYRMLLAERCGPALALHHAQHRLREGFRADPARWAPFVHIGP